MNKISDKIKKEKAALRNEKAASRRRARKLLEKKGTPKTFEYCGISEEYFPDVWGPFMAVTVEKGWNQIIKITITITMR